MGFLYQRGLPTAFLRHIGRICSDLGFIASLWEISLGFGNVPDNQTHPHSAGHPAPLPLLSNPVIFKKPPTEGVWNITDQEGSNAIDEFLREVGYPFFIRQLHKRIFNSVTITLEHGMMVGTLTGAFFGHSMTDIERRVPPIVFPYNTAPVTTPKWRLVHRGVGNSCVAKLGYRYCNVHTNFVRSDGTGFSETLCFDPKHFFRDKASTVRSVFDREAMRQWRDSLTTALEDESGLPVSIKKDHWDRRMTKISLEHADGLPRIRLEMLTFEYDTATDDWSRFRAQCTCFYNRQL
jgi:hypothetical protein